MANFEAFCRIISSSINLFISEECPLPVSCSCTTKGMSLHCVNTFIFNSIPSFICFSIYKISLLLETSSPLWQRRRMVGSSTQWPRPVSTSHPLTDSNCICICTCIVNKVWSPNSSTSQS